MTNAAAETLAALRDAHRARSLDKAFTQPPTADTGLTSYPVEIGAKKLFPVITPLRNAIPRVPAYGGIQASWRAITGVNVGGVSAGVSQGNRGGIIATTTQDFVAAYRGLGLEDTVTFEAEYSAEGFDDVKALASHGLLQALMIAEEKMILGGNTSQALGTTPTPTLVALGSGGALQNASYKVYCAALAFDGYANATLSGGVPTTITRNNADGSVDIYGGGTARISAAATVTPAAGGAINASVSPVPGAVAYAWFWGTGGAANEKLGAITTLNSVAITDAAAGAQRADDPGLAQDNSINALAFDGLIAQIARTGSNAYLRALPTGAPGAGTPLTGDGAGGIVEIDEALKAFWDDFRLSPTCIFVSAQEHKNITRKILAGNAASAQRFVFSVEQGMIAGGTMVRSYLNKYSMAGSIEIPIKLHPNMPPGALLFYSETLPYPLSNVANVVQMRTRRDYYQIDWPRRARRYEYGIYCDEVLQNYFPPAFGLLTNIADG